MKKRRILKNNGILFVLPLFFRNFANAMLTEKTMEKLRILAESAKYDVSCSSSGTVRSGKKGMVAPPLEAWASAIRLPMMAVVSRY